MNEADKRKFDAWESLRDHAWREFEDKARAEWRLSFGIWAALLSATGVVIGSNELASSISPCISRSIFAIVVVGHLFFLGWIQCKLQDARDHLNEAHQAMRTLVGAPMKEIKERNKWTQVSMYVELGITVLLGFTLLSVMAG